MELRTLRYFAAVVDAGSMNAAAALTHVTQPALSRQIAQLERELGIDLFTRHSGRLQLTTAGRQFLPVARDVLERASAARSAAASFAAGRLLHLTIAAPTTTLTDIVAPFLATLGPQDPLPAVVEADGPTALETLHHGTDLAIVTRTPPTTWSMRGLAVFPLWAYVPADHPWASRESVSLRELVDETLIVLDFTFRPRQLLEEALTAAGLALTDLVECGNSQVAQALAAAGRGIAVVSDDARFDLHPVRVLAAEHPLQVRLFAAWAQSHHAAASLAAIAERIRTFCGNRYGTSFLPGD